MSATDDVEHEAASRPSGWRDVDIAMWILALLGTVAALFSRAVAPALLGVWEGADHVIAAATLVGAASSQLLAVGSLVVLIGLVVTTLTSELPQYVRALSVGVGMLILLALSMSAVDVNLPSKSRLVVATAAAVLVLVSARHAVQEGALRASALVFGLVALGALARVATIACASQAIEVASLDWENAARVAATAHWLLDSVAIGLAIAMVTAHPRRGRPHLRPRWVFLVAVALIPLVLTWAVQLGDDPERGGVAVLLSNMAHFNRILPAPFVPEVLRTYGEFLRWGATFGLLVMVPRSGALAGALALALFSRGTLEVPLCAAAVVVGALAMGLQGAFGRGHAVSGA